MKRIIYSVFICVLLIQLSGCATVFKGTIEDVRFSSEPSKARVFVNGVDRGFTPLHLNLKSNKEYIIEFKREGYETVTREIISKVGAGWIVLDVLLGLVPVIVDAATGAWYHLNHTNLRVVLEKRQPDRD